MNVIRTSPERFKDTKHKVVCLINTPSPSIKAGRQFTSPLQQSARITDRENQIRAKEAELEEIMKEIQAKRNQRCKEFNQTAPLQSQTHKSEIIINPRVSQEKNLLISPQSSSQSPAKKVSISPAKKDVKGEKFNTMIDQALKEITNDRSSRAALLNKQKSSQKFQTVKPVQTIELKLVQETETHKVTNFEQPKIMTNLYKPILKTKNCLIKQTKPQDNKKPVSHNQSLSSTRPRSRNNSVPPQQKLEITPVVKRSYMLQTQSSQQRVRPTTTDKSPSRPTSAIQKSAPKKTATPIDRSPTFGGDADLQSEFKVVQNQLEHQRKNTGSSGFYQQLNKITYGDFKKHDSPNSRLMRQKEETHQQKCVFQSKNKKGQQYVVGIDKGYVVTTNQNLDYDLAQKKPMEFVARLEQQELVKSKLKKNGSSYTLTEKTSKRKVSQICDKARQAMLEARKVVV